MNLWIGDYAELRNEIYYLQFKLTDNRLTNKEREETRSQLEELLIREGEFRIILKSFQDIKNEILKMKYIEGMTLEKIAEELRYSPNYIRNQHAEIMNEIKRFELIYSQLVQFKKNFSIR